MADGSAARNNMQHRANTDRASEPDELLVVCVPPSSLVEDGADEWPTVEPTVECGIPRLGSGNVSFVVPSPECPKAIKFHFVFLSVPVRMANVPKDPKPDMLHEGSSKRK